MTARQVLLVPLLVVVASTAGMAQRPVTDPETIAGPWEVSGPSWTEGVFLSIDQNIQVQAYHRRDGRESWGWCTAKVEDDNCATFDGQHLRIRSGFTLDVLFDPDQHRWSGTWNRDGLEAAVILERPHPSPGSPVSPFCGQWQGVAESANPGFFASLRLHIAQSSDGTLTTWMNRSNEQHGQLFHVQAADEHSIRLRADGAIAPIPQYSADLSGDASGMVGTWDPGVVIIGDVSDRTLGFRRIGRKDCD